MSSSAEGFNRSGFAQFMNSPAGRILRIVVGVVFLILGLVSISGGQMLGILALAWSVFPLSAGIFDICYISAVLGGPISGKQIRSTFQVDN